MSVRIIVSDNPDSLVRLERMCKVARQQGFPDDAYLSFGEHRTITLRTDDESILLYTGVEQ